MSGVAAGVGEQGRKSRHRHQPRLNDSQQVSGHSPQRLVPSDDSSSGSGGNGSVDHPVQVPRIRHTEQVEGDEEELKYGAKHVIKL